MAVESLSYQEIGERLNIAPEAARALARHHRLTRSVGNDGKSRVLIDLGDIQHRKSARTPPGLRPESDANPVARIASLEAELAVERERTAGVRAAFEREKDRADRSALGSWTMR
jgi:hypothetical protein